eukprot:PhF_6_TR22263/c0_g1_i3/m.31469
MSSSCVKISVPEHLYLGQTIYGMIYNPNGLSQNDYVAVYHQGKLISYSWMLSSQQPTFHIILPPQWIPTYPREELSVSLRYFVNGGMISKGTVMASLDVVLEFHLSYRKPVILIAVLKKGVCHIIGFITVLSMSLHYQVTWNKHTEISQSLCVLPKVTQQKRFLLFTKTVPGKSIST